MHVREDSDRSSHAAGARTIGGSQRSPAEQQRIGYICIEKFQRSAGGDIDRAAARAGVLKLKDSLIDKCAAAVGAAAGQRERARAGFGQAGSGELLADLAGDIDEAVGWNAPDSVCSQVWGALKG